jgi:hypothetical protein
MSCSRYELTFCPSLLNGRKIPKYDVATTFARWITRAEHNAGNGKEHTSRYTPPLTRLAPHHTAPDRLL